MPEQNPYYDPYGQYTNLTPDNIVVDNNAQSATTKKQSPSNPGYNSITAVHTTPQQAKILLDRMTGLSDARRNEPPGYWQYVDYPHRAEFDEYHLRIGDSCFVIPPEFISIKTTTPTDSKAGIRQTNTIKTKHGYSRREIVITLYFNGFDQINGYMVTGPMSYPYYVDGLRPLLAQFLCTPFLPIENEFINATNEVFNVALANISVSTVPGFPECLQATLVMQEFNATPYLEAPNMFMDSFFDWDLHRYYYQQMMNSNSGHPSYLSPLPGIGSFTGKFDFLMLKDSALAGDASTNKDKLFADENFESIITNEDNIEITEMNFGLSNILPIIQLSDHSTPTMQYLGGMDTVFSLSFETTNRDAAAKFNDLQTRTQLLVRAHREFNGLGFVKLNNELVNLTGNRFIMINDVSVTTVPEFPDLFSITVNCVGFDGSQKDRENLFGMRPFWGDAKGTKADALDQSVQGAQRKAIQESIIEQKLQWLELYPDLRLPTYTEIDTAITAIREFRDKNQLLQIGYDKYPRDISPVPGVGLEGKYEKYLDPDFYVFYPMKYADIDDSVFDIIRAPAAPKAAPVVAPNNDWGDEGGYTNWKAGVPGDNAPASSSDGSAAGQSLTQVLLQRVGDGYVWGTSGIVLTEEKWRELKRQYGSDLNDTAHKWIGKTTFDCSGFISWGLRQIDPASKGYREACSGLWQHKCTPISKGDLKPGDLCFNGNVHVACYIGDGKTVEAMNSDKGVCIGNVDSRFNKFGRLKISQAASGNTDLLDSDSNRGQHKIERSKLDSLNGKLGGVFQGKGQDFIDIANAYTLDPFLLAAICIHETGNGTSSAVRNKNNPGGIMGSGGLKTFNTLNDGLKAVANTLKHYADQGITTIEQIGAKYAPVGAGNDPTGLNNNWVTGVEAIYRELSDGVDYTGQSSYDNWRYNENAGKTFNNKVGELDPANFGKPIFEVSPLNDKNYLASYSDTQAKFTINEADTINRQCVDMCTYNVKGRLLRAFPTYLMLVIDDSGDWLDARKLWSNYYNTKSVVDIAVHQEEDQPAHTAILHVTNVYENLSKAPKVLDIQYGLKDDPEYSWFTKKYYEWTGALLGTPKLTQKKVDAKNELFSNIDIKTGCKIHLRMGYGSNPAKLPTSINGIITEMDTADILTMVIQSHGIELINNPISSNPKDTNGVTKLQSEPSDIVASLVTDRDNWFLYTMSSDNSDPTGLKNKGGTWGEKSKYGIESFGQPMGNAVNNKQLEYDICKNIYLGKYDCVPFCDTKITLFGMDGENNINFFLYNRTPWDIMRIVEQATPEFKLQPMYHGFDTRIFYGLPTWTAKYKYDLINGTIYEYAKTFAQLHYVDSLSDVIDNQVKVTCDNLYTNCLSMYSLGGDIRSAPTCYSDKSIDWEKQRTKIIDTTVSQDYIGWDWLGEVTGTIDVGKAAAIKMAISNILHSWRETYQGEITVLGNATIKPCDYLAINDTYSKMSGIASVRQVVHTMSAETGFISSITPGMLGTSTAQNSGFINQHRTMLSWLGAVGAVRVVRTSAIQTIYHMGKVPAFSFLIKAIDKSSMFTRYTGSGLYAIYKGVRTGQIFTEFSAFTADFMATVKATKQAKSIVTLVNAIKGGAAAVGTVAGGPVGTAIAWVVTTVIFDMLLTSLIDTFAYNNVINLQPLVYKDLPFVSGTKGSTKLVSGFADSDPKAANFVTDGGYTSDGSH